MNMYTYILMITSSFMGEPSGFLRNSGIFLSVSELLMLLRGFVAFFFVTFFVAQVSNLLGDYQNTFSFIILSKLYIRYNNYRMVHIRQKIFYVIPNLPAIARSTYGIDGILKLNTSSNLNK